MDGSDCQMMVIADSKASAATSERRQRSNSVSIDIDKAHRRTAMSPISAAKVSMPMASRAARSEVDDLLGGVRQLAQQGYRTLVTVLAIF